MKRDCNELDKHALLILKKGVLDPKSSLSSWSIKEDCCEWFGVQCDNITGRVISLDLGCSRDDVSFECLNLRGDINLPLFLLESLNLLDLSGNHFHTMNLCKSNVYYNLSKTMSSHPCGNFSNLEHLDLSYNTNLHINNLQWISHFTSLKSLSLSGIDLHKETYWSQHISMLPSLSKLSLRSC